MTYLKITTFYPQSRKQLKGGQTMKGLYKVTLLITMAVVTWKVWKIEGIVRKNHYLSKSSIRTARPSAVSKH